LKVPYRINESQKMQRKWHLLEINEKWHHGCPEFHEAAKIMPIIEIEHRILITMQFVNPIKMMVMANSKTIFYFALIVCVRKSIDTIVQKNTAA